MGSSADAHAAESKATEQPPTALVGGARLLPLLAILLFWALLAMPFLGSAPRVWMDEPQGTISAVHLLHTGRAEVPEMWFSSPLSSPQLTPQLAFYLFLAGGLGIDGVSPFTSRLPLALAGLATLLLTYRLAVTRTNSQTALVACFLLGIDSLFFLSERTVRSEMLVATLGMASLLLAVRTDQSRRWVSGAGAGLIAGLGLWVHPNFAITALAVACAALAAHGRKGMLRWVVYYVCGVVVGFMPYVAYVVAVDAGSGFARLKYQMGGRTAPITSTGGFLKTTFVAELERYRSYVAFPYRVGVFLVQVGVVVLTALRPRDALDRALLVFIGVHLALFPLLVVARTSRYFTVLMPAVAILLARWLRGAVAELREDTGDRAVSALRGHRAFLAIGLIICALYAANQMAGDAWVVLRTRGHPYSEVAEKLSSVIPSGAKVFGSITYWYAFQDHPFRFAGIGPGSWRPDYVILYDSDMWGTFGAASGLTKVSQPGLDQPYRDAMQTLVDERGTEVLRLEAGPYGTPTIYRLDWSDSPPER